MKIKINECFPNSEFFQIIDGSPKKVSSTKLFNEKKIILVGVPGAFTPTCSNEHLPGYIENYESFVSKGIDDIYFVSVNDPFVMNKWGELSKSNVKFIADSDGEFMKKSGFEMDLSAAGLGNRLTRFSMLIDNGLVVEIFDENGPGLDVSKASNMLDKI
tara:strand:- start:768 stop:1244 length:477 start_codon:yes stop_codon:yes gene_type:complete